MSHSIAVVREGKLQNVQFKVQSEADGQPWERFPLLTTRQIAGWLGGGLAHRFKRFQSQNERLDGTGPEALTYCIRVKLDALRLYAESRVVFKQRSQSIRTTDGG